MNFSAALQRYERVLSGYLSPSSVKTYRSRLTFAASFLAGRDLDRITLVDLEDLLATYRETRKANTSALMTTVLKQFFAWCVDVELLTKDPAAKLKAPRRTKWQPRALSAAAIDALLDSIHATTNSTNWRQVRNEALVRLLLFAGLRRAEAAGLMWADVDLPGRMLTVTGKGEKTRPIPLHTSLVDSLQRLQGLSAQIDGAVLARECTDSNPLHPYTINVIFKKWIVKRLGFNVTPHRLRHSFATRLIERGAQLDEVRDLLGHESIATTQVYVYTSAERLRTAIDRL